MCVCVGDISSMATEGGAFTLSEMGAIGRLEQRSNTLPAGETWSDSISTFKVNLAGVSYGLDGGWERDEPKVLFGQSKWNNKADIF